MFATATRITASPFVAVKSAAGKRRALSSSSSQRYGVKTKNYRFRLFSLSLSVFLSSNWKQNVGVGDAK